MTSATRTVTLTPTQQPDALDQLHGEPIGRQGQRGQPDGSGHLDLHHGGRRLTGVHARSGPTAPFPATTAANDSSAVELGVKFRASQAGYITGIRFYKGTGNTGTHTGSLWNSTGGTKLATVTFTGESATGWQQATFSAPVPVNANTTYVASYYAPVGRYAINTNYFASAATTRGPLTALRNGTDGGNGVYKYGASGFPNSTYQSSNYWVDVVFDTTANDTTAPTVVAKMPASDSSGVAVSTAVSATFSEAVAGSSVAMELRDPDNSLVPATTSYNSDTQTATLTPSAAACGLDEVHGEGERCKGRGRKHHDTCHLVIHDGSSASATTGPGPGRPDRAGHVKLEPVLQVPRRNPADRGPQRVQDHRCRHALGTALAAYDVVVLGNVM